MDATGLAEPFNLRAKDGWNALTKIDGGATWREEISAELIENFLVAIHRDELRVQIHGDDLTCDTLKNFVRRYADKLPTAADKIKIGLSASDYLR